VWQSSALLRLLLENYRCTRGLGALDWCVRLEDNGQGILQYLCCRLTQLAQGFYNQQVVDICEQCGTVGLILRSCHLLLKKRAWATAVVVLSEPDVLCHCCCYVLLAKYWQCECWLWNFLTEQPSTVVFGSTTVHMCRPFERGFCKRQRNTNIYKN
jgi:hypothetical protein